MTEPVKESHVFRVLAAIKGDALAVFAHARHRETEVRFIALLFVVQIDQLAADEMRQRGADDGIQQREPKHIAGNFQRGSADRYGEHAGQVPEHDGKGCDRGNLLQQSEQKLERQADEKVDVLLDTLVRVVHAAAARDLETVVGLILQPRRQVLSCHPCAPADLEKLPQVDRVDGDSDINEGDHRELADQRPEKIVFISLEGVVKFVVPTVELNEQIDHREIHGDDDGKQPNGPLLFLGAPVAAE